MDRSAACRISVMHPYTVQGIAHWATPAILDGGNLGLEFGSGRPVERQLVPAETAEMRVNESRVRRRQCVHSRQDTLRFPSRLMPPWSIPSPK